MGFGQYVKDTKAEMRHVSWPTQRQAIIYTILVIIISLLIAAYIGLFDWIFKSVVDTFFVSGNETAITAPGSAGHGGSMLGETEIPTAPDALGIENILEVTDTPELPASIEVTPTQ